MNKCYVYLSLLWILFALPLSSCNDQGKDAPDVSSIKIAYTSYPFYKDFSALDTTQILNGLHQLKNKYPGFLDFYLDTLAGFGFFHEYNDTNRILKDFLTLKDYRNLMDTVNKVFPNTRKLDEELKSSFQYIKYYDSTFAVPEHIYYFVSGLNGITAVYQNEKNIGIGLDMFLGRGFKPYISIGIPDYGTIRMTAEHIPVWVNKVIYEDKYPFYYEDRTLLDMMIQRGKELYFIDKTAPYLKEEVRLGYTPEQMKWCNEHEAMIYNFFIQNNLIFDKNLQKTMRFVTDGPSTAGMPAESPGNVASFTGLRIVQRYMDNHKISLHELLEQKDAQKILDGAKYKP